MDQDSPPSTASPVTPVPQLCPSQLTAPVRWHSPGGSLRFRIPLTSPVIQEANEGSEERSGGMPRGLGDPRWVQGYRMTQGGRLLVIFSSGSPFLALRMASIS